MKQDHALVDKLLASIRVDAGGCFLWQGHINKYGYAHLYWNGRARRAHRLSFEAFRRPIPPGLCVCHRCDVRACINPAHLFVGTHLDNMRDAVAKGRVPHGEQRPDTKLTDEQVAALVALCNAGASAGELAEHFGISIAQVMRLMDGTRRRHVPRPATMRPPLKARGERNAAATLTEQDVIAIRLAYQAGGVRQQDLADKYGVTSTSISNVVLRYTWSHVP